MFACSPPPAVICAEKIALLHLLHPVAVPPSCNKINKPPFRQGSYSLSFTRERTLASTLAFLPNTEDDSNHVPALCIEENPELASLNVMLAVNRTKCEGGNGVLQNIKRSAITAEEDGLPEMGLSDEPAKQLSARCSHQRTGHKVTLSDIAELIQGVPQVDSIVVAREPQFHVAGALEIHIEYTAKMTALGGNRNDLEIVYNIKWLSVEKARELLGHEAATVVDVEALQCQTSHTLDCDNDILIMARGALVRIIPRHKKEKRAGEGQTL
jgi:hypothetical protein